MPKANIFTEEGRFLQEMDPTHSALSPPRSSSKNRNNNPVPITEESGNANSAAEEHDGGGGLTAAQQSEDERIMAKEALEAMKVIKQFTAEKAAAATTDPLEPDGPPNKRSRLSNKDFPDTLVSNSSHAKSHEAASEEETGSSSKKESGLCEMDSHILGNYECIVEYLQFRLQEVPAEKRDDYKELLSDAVKNRNKVRDLFTVYEPEEMRRTVSMG